jgi:peptide/nickel transport system substrate-binding protein
VGQNPVGPGPYKVKEWVHGSYVLLERNDLYKTNLPFVQNKGPNPYIDEVMIRFIPEDLTRISELEAGTVDIVRGVPSDAVANLKTNPDVTLYESITPGIVYLMINVRRPPLDDVRVRKALIYAINRNEIKTTLEDTVLPCYSYMSPSMLAYNASVEEYASQIYAYNNETAKNLLAEAGWVDTNGDGIVDKDGQPLRLELLIPNDEPKFKRIGPLLQAKLASIGIDVDYKEFAYSYIRSKTREWDFELAGRFYSWFDPAGILPYLLHSEIGNYTYSNPEVDSLFDEDRSTALSPTERTALYTEIQNILLEDVPWVPLYIDISYTAVRKNVEGLIVMPPFATLFIQDVKIKVVKGG